MKHLMVDIETMGNTSYSAIVSIAAVEFDLDTGKTGREFSINVDFQSCLDIGLTVDASTVLWWLEQSKAASDSFKSNPVGIEGALAMFTNWVGLKDYQIWGNSARFDLGLLQNAYNKIGQPICWKFWNERCVRTLASFNPDIKKYMEFTGVPHNAIDDCKHQIKYCSKIWEFNKK